MLPPWMAVLLSKVLVVTVSDAGLVVDRATLESHAARERAVCDDQSSRSCRSLRPVRMWPCCRERRERDVERAALVVDGTAIVDGRRCC